jgi:molybdenum cofactor guanylyltransferase
MARLQRAVRSPVLGAVLAGGRASRMGGSKATAMLGGRPLISYALGAVKDAGLDALVLAKQKTELPDVDVPVLRESAPDFHPLHGVVEALRAAHGRPVVVIACDMPFASGTLLSWLARIPGNAVPSVGGVLEPLLARYDGAALNALALGIAEGEAAQETVRALYPRLIARAEIAAFGDPERLFFNVNEPEDLLRAATLLRARISAE